MIHEIFFFLTVDSRTTIENVWIPQSWKKEIEK